VIAQGTWTPSVLPIDGVLMAVTVPRLGHSRPAGLAGFVTQQCRRFRRHSRLDQCRRRFVSLPPFCAVLQAVEARYTGRLINCSFSRGRLARIAATARFRLEPTLTPRDRPQDRPSGPSFATERAVPDHDPVCAVLPLRALTSSGAVISYPIHGVREERRAPCAVPLDAPIRTDPGRLAEDRRKSLSQSRALPGPTG
jgi:hypothetical protein